MHNKEISKFDPNYPYDHKDIHVEKKMYKYPIIERTNNGLLFPEGPKNEVDMEMLKES